jgi:uncharacterized protein (DUF1697 family)
LKAEPLRRGLEARLLAYAGKPIGVVVRTTSEMQAVLKENPFPKAPPNYTVAIFLDEQPPSDALEHAVGYWGSNVPERQPTRNSSP